MDVTMDRCAELLHGAIRYELDDRGLQAWRMTEQQITHFSAGSPAWSIRCRIPAGISLRLLSDSDHLTLRWLIQGLSRPWMGVDLVIDGRPLLRQSIETVDDGQTVELDFDLSACPSGADGQRELHVYLPHTVGGWLQGLGLADAARLAPVNADARRLICIGDSITQGMVAEGSATTYAVSTARALGWDLLNQGVGGHVFDAASFDAAIPGQADLITIAYGTNDWATGRSSETICSAAREHIETIRARWPDAPIVAILPLWRRDHDEDRGAGPLRALCTRLAETIETLPGVHCLDGFSLVPHDETRNPDGLHPNEAGFAHYTEGLLRALRGFGLAGT